MSEVLTHRGRRALVAIALGGLACCIGTVTAQPVGIADMTVEVFVNSAMAVTLPAALSGLRVTVHRMDQLDLATQAIDQQIPRGGEAEARRWVEANQARIKRQVQPAAIATANAISLATHYRIDRLPAVVINKQTVVYGVTDVNVALQHYQASRGGRP
jgi:integrating conjugative element protein (TIGR03757 family)